MEINRRRFLWTSAAVAALPCLPALGQDANQTVTLTLHPERAGAVVPESFVGLSYETQQLSDPSFFSAKNTGLIAMFRALTPRGVLRLGGNTSDVGWWKAKAKMQRPQWPARVTASQATIDLAYAITPESVRNLRRFLDATGWTCLYGINLGTNTPERAAEEAAFVAKTLGPRLEYFQLGNEPNLFPTRLRDPKTWSADAYMDEWLAEADAIRKRVPGARFGILDASANAAWLARIEARLGALEAKARPVIASVNQHYYFGGPPSNPRVNIERLLQPDAGVLRSAAVMKEAAETLGCAYRMTEGNTCYSGGKPGVSDVFAAALWAADYMLLLASLGYAGVNLHGGSGKEVANSLGGTLPGEKLMADPTAPHPRPFYTPIAEMDGKYVAEPVYYGMLLAQRFAGATMVPVEFDPGMVNATAYAGKRKDGSLIVAIINKDQRTEITVNLEGHTGACTRAMYASSMLSHDVVFDVRYPGLAGYLKNHATDVLRQAPNGLQPFTCGTSFDAGYYPMILPAGSAVFIDSLN